MNISEILPTDENLAKAFQDDAIHRNKDVAEFYELLLSIDSVNAIAIDGRWGSGKTFFVKQTILLIKTLNSLENIEDSISDSIHQCSSFKNLFNENKGNSFATVYFDAWQQDNNIDPIISIVYEIAKQLGTVNLPVANGRLVELLSAIIDAFSGRSIKEIADSLKGEDPLSKFKDQEDVHKQIETFLNELPKERGNKVLIFIDELDRCKPTYAVRLLEQIKHYLCNERIVFIFSINTGELQHTVGNYYGSGFDSSRYLDRFFDLRFSLPPADLNYYYDSINFNSNDTIEIICKRIINVYKFELREIMRFYTGIKIALGKFVKMGEGQDWAFRTEKWKEIILIYVVPIVIGLRIVDASEYYAFIEGKDSRPFHDVLENSDAANWIFQYLLNDNETYGNEEGKIHVTEGKKTDELYNAIFVNDYKDVNFVKIGEYVFDARGKEFALQVASSLSKYADYDDDKE